MTGVDGKFDHAIQSLYKVPIACVSVNEYRTDWFPTPSSVKHVGFVYKGFGNINETVQYWSKI